MKSAVVPTVFIIDDDRGMRQAIQDLVESVGLRAEAFATGQDFLRRQVTGYPSCLVLDVRLPQLSGLDFQRQLAESGVQIHHFYYGAWRHSHVCQGIEVGRRGISDKTFQGPGSAGRHSAGPPA
jgi:FixJ family two-component response regulator